MNEAILRSTIEQAAMDMIAAGHTTFDAETAGQFFLKRVERNNELCQMVLGDHWRGKELSKALVHALAGDVYRTIRERHKAPQTAFQPRYLAYSKARQVQPEDMHQVDGGSTVGFMCWIREQWVHFQKLTGVNLDRLTKRDHEAFDLWLSDGTLPI